MFWQIVYTVFVLFFYLVFFGKALDPDSCMDDDEKKFRRTLFALGIIPLLAVLAYIWS